MKLFRRKDELPKLDVPNYSEVPDELPALALDEIKNLSSLNKKNNSSAIVINSLEGLNSLNHTEIDNLGDNISNISQEKGFFSTILKEIASESKKINIQEKKYKEKLLSFDLLDGMKKFWEKNQSSTLLNLEEKKLENKLVEKIVNLQNLEKTWQEKKLELVDVEEQIRLEEFEIKRALKDFKSRLKTHAIDKSRARKK